jgi:asparagine synthase (glutamine-hydrolysing)
VSALAAIFHKNGKVVDRARVAAMIAAIPIGETSEGKVVAEGAFATGIGGARLLNSNVVHNDGIIAALSGRIDNRQELIAALDLPADIDVGHMLVAAYRHWGDDYATHLRGDFVVFLWDGTVRRLIAARDLVGVRPLYYYENAQDLYLASHPAAIIAICPTIGTIQDNVILGNYAAGYVDSGERTLHPGIHRVMSGHMLTATTAGSRIARYASWSTEIRSARQDAPEHFAELLDRSVRNRMVGTKPVASLLSGGLDSSSVVAMAQRQAHRTGTGLLRTYSQVFPDDSHGDERSFVMAMVSQGNLDPKFLDCTHVAAFDDLDKTLAVQAGPFIGPNLATTLHTYRRVAGDGYRILLDGHGGDESVSSGLACLFDDAYALRLLPLWRNVREIARMEGFRATQLIVNLLRKRGPHTGKSQRHTALQGQPRPDWLGPFAQWPVMTPREPNLGRESFAEHVDSLTSPFFVQALELLAHASASEGIDLRFPLLDRDLIAWCLAAPAEEKFANGYPRALLRNGMVGYLPDKVRYRRDKFDFTGHVVSGMMRADRDMVEGVLNDKDGRLQPFFNMAVLQERWKALQHPSHNVDGHSIQAIWRAIVLGRWLQLQG